jgi:hypothetical protein
MLYRTAWILPRSARGGRTGGIAVRRATSDDWSRYYECARQRRRVIGGDPLTKYLKRRDTREKRFFIGSSVLLLSVLIAFYSVLVR